MSNKFNPDEYIGKKYGKLTIVTYDKERSLADTKWHRHFFFCSCECNPDKILEKSIRIQQLKSGHTVSCGCRKSDIRTPSLEKSLGYFCVNNIDKDFSENRIDKEKCGDIDIFKIFANSDKTKLWIKCLDVPYHGSYETTPVRITAGYRCPYCASNKIHPKDSFGQMLIDEYGSLETIWNFEKNGDLDPFGLAKQSHTKIWLNCLGKTHHGSYETTPNRYTQHNARCPYCAGKKVHKRDSLGFLYPQSLKIWSSKNTISPFDVAPMSHKVVFWDCKIHGEYKRTIHNSNICQFGCPRCMRKEKSSRLQKLTSKHLDNFGYIITHEYDCSILPINPKTKNPLPFDNVVEDLKLVIEVHGKQHYEVVEFFHDINNGKTPEENFRYQQVKDRYKQYIAWKNGYEYLAIPYWTEQDGSYIELINNKIEEILLNKNIK